MRIFKSSALFTLYASVLVFTGCASELQDLKTQNRTQRKLLTECHSDLQATKLELTQAKRLLDTADSRTNIQLDALNQQITSLEEDAAKKKALIDEMQRQLLEGGLQLPAELSTMLEDFAKDEEMVTYDSARGLLKFYSDLLFEKGSVKVASAAKNAVESLCKILNTEQAKGFDIIIAGHTDDIPIGKPHTRAKHPTNWHLSAHRAIATLKVMAQNRVAQERMSIRGFGEFRPIAPNKPNKRGNQQNRRVEIYIVPKGL